jgi:hypothetical protein
MSCLEISVKLLSELRLHDGIHGREIIELNGLSIVFEDVGMVTKVEVVLDRDGRLKVLHWLLNECRLEIPSYLF